MTNPRPEHQMEPERASVSPPSSAAGPNIPLEKRREGLVFKAVQAVSVAGVIGLVLFIFLVFVLGVPIPGMQHEPDDELEIRAQAPLGVRLVEGQPHTLLVPEDIRATLGIRKGGKDQVEVVKAPTQTRSLVLYGSTMLDPERLMRIRARFAPAEVVSIGMVHDLNPRTGQSEFRELRPGDRVQKGDVLGVFFSVDVGCKKNNLLDALVQLELDQKILDGMDRARSAVPEVTYQTQLRAVYGDRNALTGALNNLKIWNIPQEEIDALHEEAKKITADKNAWFKTPAGRWATGEKQGTGGRVDPDRENDNPWGRVTLRAPFDGIIVERNIVPHEIVQDPTINLFQIAQVHRLLVIANAPEDELPNLNALGPSDRVWTVKTVGGTASTELKGPIEEIGYLIDPNQHTAVIKGYIDNPKEQIRAGQFISATVRIPPPQDVVEIPIDAVVEDGKSCVVFVQPDKDKPHYTMRRVQLTHRFEKTALVRSKPFLEQEKLTVEEKEQGLLPLEPLRPNERVLKTGVGELKAALLELESRPASKDQKREVAEMIRKAGLSRGTR